MDHEKSTERTSLASRVRAGVALLDEKQPGWHNRVSLEQLWLSSCFTCVLGQLFGSFGVGRRELMLSEGDGAPAHGFDVEYRPLGSSGPEYDALQRLWSFVIRQRQAVSQ